MSNNIFHEMNIKKSYPLGVGGWKKWRKHLNFLLELWLHSFGYPGVLLGYSSNIHPLCIRWVLDVLVPSNDLFLYNTTTLLKSDVFWHSKDYSSQSFGPTRMGLGSFWRGLKWVSKTVLTNLFSHNFFLINS